MFEILCVLTGAVIALTAIAAYLHSHDAFHPAIVMAPMFGYTLAVSPIMLNSAGGLDFYFSAEQLEYVQSIYLFAMIAFAAGLLSVRPRQRKVGWQRFELTPAMARRLYRAGIALGVISVAAFIIMLENVGGFVEAYSRPKGGGRPPSGYVGEAVLLSFPGVLFVALARRAAGRIRPRDVALAILIMSPHLIHGTFGGRRGPLFLALTMLFFAWLIARGHKPSFKKTVTCVATIGLAVLFVSSQRGHVYLGSEEEVSADRFWEKLRPERVEPGDTYVYSAAKTLEADYYGEYYWGYRYFVTFFIRPIPRQLWPTKYEDMGATWVMGIDDHMERGQQVQAVGFMTPSGSAMPSVADVYLEFSWGVLPFFVLLGRLFARIWTWHCERGGVWSVVHCVMLALSIYLASQSFSAWAHRLLFIGLPTIVLWKYWIVGQARRRTAAASLAHPYRPERRAAIRPAGVRSLR